jgi:hypothetical protein
MSQSLMQSAPSAIALTIVITLHAGLAAPLACRDPGRHRRAPRPPTAAPTAPAASRARWRKKIFPRLVRAGWTYSIGVRQQKHIKAAIAAIAEQDWQVLADYPEIARRRSPRRCSAPSA